MSHYFTNVGVDLHDLLDAVGLHQGRSDSLFHSQTHSLWCLDTNGCGAQLQEQKQPISSNVNKFFFSSLSNKIMQKWNCSKFWMTLTFIASMAYSTWNSLPSGENVLTPLQNTHTTLAHWWHKVKFMLLNNLVFRQLKRFSTYFPV